MKYIYEQQPNIIKTYTNVFTCITKVVSSRVHSIAYNTIPFDVNTNLMEEELRVVTNLIIT